MVFVILREAKDLLSHAPTRIRSSPRSRRQLDGRLSVCRMQAFSERLRRFGCLCCLAEHCDTFLRLFQTLWRSLRRRNQLFHVGENGRVLALFLAALSRTAQPSR